MVHLLLPIAPGVVQFWDLFLQVLQAFIGLCLGFLRLCQLGLHGLQALRVRSGHSQAVLAQPVVALLQLAGLVIHAALFGRQHLNLLLHLGDQSALFVGLLGGPTKLVFETGELGGLLFQLGGQDLGLLGGTVVLGQQLPLLGQCGISPIGPGGQLFGQLQQALLNYASNAVKFTDQGQIRMRVSLDDQLIAFAVTDTGPGIPPEAQSQVFEKFKQLENFLTRQHQGTGLGLALVKQLVEHMGGRVTLESVVGEGSTFTIYLPQEPSNV